MELTKEHIIAIMPHSAKRIDKFMSYINPALKEFGITTKEQICAWLAQVGHESGEFLYVRELASGEAYDTGKKAIQLGNTPEADGDGQRYKGRGLIQITGKRNYLLCGMALDADFVANPELLERPDYAVRSAAWFWYNNNLNRYCNPCTPENFVLITKRINGGTNGLIHRQQIWEKSKKVLHNF